MNLLTNKHAGNCVRGDSNNDSVSTVVATTSLLVILPTSSLSRVPPVIVGSLSSSKKRTKRRPIDGLRLGSLPQASMTNSSASHFANQAFNPFFSNRQNMKLSHGSIKERFPVMFPDIMQYNIETGSVNFDNKQHQMRYYGGMLNNYTLPS